MRKLYEGLQSLKDHLLIIIRVKHHFIYKIQRPWSMHGVCPTKQRPTSSVLFQTLRTQTICLLQCLPEDVLISYGIQRRKKSAFDYCLVMVSLACKFYVVSLNWSIRGLWIDLLLWEIELETSSQSGSLEYSQPPQLTSG